METDFIVSLPLHKAVDQILQIEHIISGVWLLEVWLCTCSLSSCAQELLQKALHIVQEKTDVRFGTWNNAEVRRTGFVTFLNETLVQ
jgi:hypothetical protein